MSSEQSSSVPSRPVLTLHAMLVVWGLFAQQIGLVEAMESVSLHQKTRQHRPQTKVLEFLVAILAGLAHLQDISRSAHPLDQDAIVAEAWEQPAWADYSGVSRTLQRLTPSETQQIIATLVQVSQPFIDEDVQQALRQEGRLVYDADLTGRPVSSTSTSYPDTAFGYMGDTIRLGYQAAVVSLHSPLHGRLWLANQLHPGDTVSVGQARSLVQAAEQRTGVRPRRRTELVTSRLKAAEGTMQVSQQRRQRGQTQLEAARTREVETGNLLAQWKQSVDQYEAEYRQQGRVESSHCKLARARRKVGVYQRRLPRCQNALEVAQRRLRRYQRQYQQVTIEVEQLRQHLQQLLTDNAADPQPIQAVFRLDGGFASKDNLAWLIEMGYDVYTKAQGPYVKEILESWTTSETSWQRVGGNGTMAAWADTTVDDYFPYPLDVALAHYHTGDTVRRAVFLHYGQEAVTHDLSTWFHMYNARQTIEAGIKEGKGVFQMHHFKVRSPQAILLQEHFATFAANFVRWAGRWLASQQNTVSPKVQTGVKQAVHVMAHTSALVLRQGDDWLLRFTEQSLYAGQFLRVGKQPIQLPLPLFKCFHFSHS
jgi:hypothetical protein